MAYIVGQYNKNSSTNSMTTLKGGSVARLSSLEENGTGFEEECFQYDNLFQKDQVYYFHGSVKRTFNKQSFEVILINDDDFEETQSVKSFEVKQGNSGWIDIEFIFKPVKNFNRLAFVLQRTKRDYYGGEIRYPVIIYQELSRVENLVPAITGGASILKLGAQAEPGFITVINGEEIRLGKTGMYEVRNGLIEINFFSAVAPANSFISIEDKQQEIDSVYGNTDLSQRSLSLNLIDYANGNDRDLTDFTLDYVYDEGGNE